jgi:hypothetical protein
MSLREHRAAHQASRYALRDELSRFGVHPRNRGAIRYFARPVEGAGN